jgi:hypothetical protein
MYIYTCIYEKCVEGRAPSFSIVWCVIVWCSDVHLALAPSFSIVWCVIVWCSDVHLTLAPSFSIVCAPSFSIVCAPSFSIVCAPSFSIVCAPSFSIVWCLIVWCSDIWCTCHTHASRVCSSLAHFSYIHVYIYIYIYIYIYMHSQYQRGRRWIAQQRSESFVCILSVCHCIIQYCTLTQTQPQFLTSGCVCVRAQMVRHTYIHTHAHTYIHTKQGEEHPRRKWCDSHTHTHTYIHTYIHAKQGEEHPRRKWCDTHTHIHTYIRTYIHTYKAGWGASTPQMARHTYIHTHIHTHTHIHHTYIHTHTHIHTYVHTYIRTKQDAEHPRRKWCDNIHCVSVVKQMHLIDDRYPDQKWDAFRGQCFCHACFNRWNTRGKLEPLVRGKGGKGAFWVMSIETILLCVHTYLKPCMYVCMYIYIG